MIALLCASGCGASDPASDVEFTFGEQGLGPGQFAYPRAMAVSPVDGCVFAIDKTARVQRFSAEGKFEKGWRTPASDNGKPTGVHVDRENRVLVADTHYSRVLVYDRDGQELFRFGSPGEGPLQFGWPTNVTTDGDGFIYVAEYGGNNRISKLTHDGEFVLSFAHGEAEQGGTARPQGLTIDHHGVLWVADSAHHRICRYSRDGEFLGSFGTMGEGYGQFRYPYEVAALGDDTLLICDYENNRIVQTGTDGRWLRTWGGVGREPGRLLHPWSLDVGPNGRVYVLDSWNNRVQVIKW